MGEIYLIRHGQASFGTDDYDRLSELGARQARVLGAHLGRLGLRFDAAYCGRMRRQRDTAAALRVAYETDDRRLPALREAEAFDEYDSAGVWNALLPRVIAERPELGADAEQAGSDRRSFQRLFAAVMGRWIAGDADPPGIDRWADFKLRVRTGFEGLIAAEGPRRTMAVFSSGGPIAAVVQTVLSLSDAATLDLSWQIRNASVTRIRYGSQGAALAVFNEVSHLELAGEPQLLTYR